MCVSEVCGRWWMQCNNVVDDHWHHTPVLAVLSPVYSRFHLDLVLSLGK
jgi:hypothetical protein